MVSFSFLLTRRVPATAKTKRFVVGSFHYLTALWMALAAGFGAQAQTVSYSPVHDNASFNAQTINVNLAVGSTPASADVSSSGGSTYSIPIALPPGTNGVVPSVGLVYNSQAGNGIAGTGWSISGLSVITRTSRSMYYDNETNAVEMSANDRFVLDGARLIGKSGTYGADGATYGTESENFATVTSNSTQGNGPEWFQVVTKDGVIMEFGHTPESRYTGQFATVLTWALSKIQYPDGNYIEFNYTTLGTFNLLIDQINYTGNAAAGLTPYNQVKFDYKIRQDVNTLYQADTKIESKYLLDKITVTAEGQAVKTYQLGYGTDPSYGAGLSYGSYLKSLTEAGSDGSTLNATNFKYGDAPANFSSLSTGNVYGTGIVNLSGDFNGDGITDILAANHQVYQPNPGQAPVYYFSTKFSIYVKDLNTTDPDDYAVGALHFLPAGASLINNRDVVNAYSTFMANDFTGDGVDDVLMAKINQGSPSPTLNFIRLYRSIPNPNALTNGQPPIDFDSLTIDPPVGNTRLNASGNFLFPGDFNGDGIQDILSMLGNTVNGGNTAHVYYSQQSGASFGTIGTSGSLHFSINQWADADKVLVLDFNGDGKSDLMLIKNSECEVITLDGYSARQLYYTPNNQFLNNNTLLYPGDFNGDQKTDLLTQNKSTNQWKIEISTGKLYLETPFSFNRTVNTDPYTGDQLTVADFNGDGKADICNGWQVSAGNAQMDVYYGNGYDQSGQTANFIRVNQSWTGDLGTGPGGNLGALPVLIGDANGDGRADLINYKDISHPMDIFYFRRGGTETLLEKTKNGYGHEVRFSYKKLTDQTPFYSQGALTAYPLLTMQLPMYAVSEQSAQDGIGGLATTQYTYAGLRLHRAGKGFLGFTTLTATNLTTGIKTVSTNQFDPTFFAPAPYQTSTYLGNDLLSQTTLANEWVDLGNKRFWYRVNATNTNNAFAGRTASSSNQYDSYGNVTQNQTNNNGVETTTTTTQYGQFGTPIPARPTQTTTTKTRSGQSYGLTTTFSYNGLGQLTSKTDFSGLPQSVTTNYTYNTTGNVTNTSVAPAGMTPRASSATFDSKGRFALTSTNVLGQTASATYDARWGKPLTSTGIDGLTMSYQYDAWGRTTQTTMPEGYAINQSWGWDQSNGAVYYNMVQHPGKPDVKSWMDVLGREVRKETEGFGGQTITQAQSYDVRGNVASATQPYLPGETVRTTTTSYDPYDRAESVSVTGIGTTFVTYNYAGGNLTVTTTNPAGQVSSKVTDASGQTIQATDHGGTLAYTYNAQGNVLTVSNGGATLTAHQYDAYGRQTQLTDQNAGTTTYAYNAAGELTTQTNANGHTHTMQYDEMGRVTSRSGPDGPNPTTTEYYPTGSAAVNQVKKITGFAGNVSEYAYDSYGRLTTSTETIDGTAYTTSYTYNTYGDITSKSFPSGFGTNHAYDGNGYLTSIKNSTNSVTLYSAGTQNGLGQPLTYSLGNGKTSSNTYVNNMPTHYATPGVQDLTLTWEYASGNLQSRQDGLKNKTESFTYDNLNRLTGSTVSGLGGIYQNYTPSGNITDKTDAGTYSYLATKPNAVSAVSNPGTVIPLLEQFVSYTPFLQPHVLTENNYELTYTYGADYERIKGVLKQNNTLLRTRYYTGAGYEKDIVNGGATRDIHYINSPAGLIAIVVRENGNDTYHYVYSDHLGSILTVTDAGGSVEAEQNFDAWGRRRNPADWSYTGVPARPEWLYRGYTGHEHLDPFVLINMNGRIYDPVVGRVLSPDNFVQDPFSTQDFNRYSYGFNNPLKYSDPDGNNPILGAIIGGLSYVLGVAFSDGGFGNWNWGQFAGSVAIGAFTGGIAEGITAATAGLGPIASGAISGAVAGGIGGGFSSAFAGGDFGRGFWQGGLIGGALGALGGALRSNEDYPFLAFNDPPVKTVRGGWLPSVTVKASRLIARGSSNFNNWFTNAGTVAGLTANYFLGFGPESRTYINTSEADAFRNSYITNQARNFWYNEVNAGHKTIYDGVSNYLGKRQFGGGNFGPKGAVQAGIDPMEQYVGGFSPVITSDGQNLTFTINNTTSFKSFSYRIGPSWSRSAFPQVGNLPMGNIHQSFIFTEPIQFRVK